MTTSKRVRKEVVPLKRKQAGRGGDLIISLSIGAMPVGEGNIRIKAFRARRAQEVPKTVS
jgi:hypothetical protein